MANLTQNPDSLTYFYMDTYMCNEFFLLNEECMDRYNSIWRVRYRKRKTVHKQCLNYLDQYKACLIGINMHSVGAQQRKVLTGLNQAPKKQTNKTAKPEPDKAEERIKL